MKQPLSFEGTVDPTELLWQQHILPRYPAYATLWSEFIGTRLNKEKGQLLPYRMRFQPSDRQPLTFSEDDEKYFRWQGVCMGHYQTFTALAGAFYHESQLQTSWTVFNGGASDAQTRLKHFFLFREEFDCVYIRLQSAVEFAENFGKAALRWMKTLRGSGATSILDYARRAGNQGKCLDMLLEELKRRVTDARGFTAHIGRLPTSAHAAGYLVPVMLLDPLDPGGRAFKEGIDMLDEADKERNWELMHVRAPKDIELACEFAELIDGLVLPELRRLVKEGYVEIDYDSGQTKQEIADMLLPEADPDTPLPSCSAQPLTGTNVERLLDSGALPGSGDQVRLP
jgi:hypothetical protein